MEITRKSNRIVRSVHSFTTQAVTLKTQEKKKKKKNSGERRGPVTNTTRPEASTEPREGPAAVQISEADRRAHLGARCVTRKNHLRGTLAASLSSLWPGPPAAAYRTAGATRPSPVNTAQGRQETSSSHYLSLISRIMAGKRNSFRMGAKLSLNPNSAYMGRKQSHQHHRGRSHSSWFHT